MRKTLACLTIALLVGAVAFSPLSDAEEASRQARRTGTADRRILAHAAAIEQALGRGDASRTF